MSFVKKIQISIAVALVASTIFSIYTFAKTSEQIRGDFIRLHVIANSDSFIDQELKLSVRDYILDVGSDIFDGTVNPSNVYYKIPDKLPFLENQVCNFIKSQGYNYKVFITLEEEYFTTRTYNTVTLPAGEYTALKIVIGEGRGKNWWCVMFPPMCISAADEQHVLSKSINEDELKLVNKNPKYDVRFKIVEIIEKVKFTFNNNK